MHFFLLLLGEYSILVHQEALTLASNAVQFITSIFLLRSRQYLVLQTSLIGAILSNSLLMQGLGYICGGYNRMEQFFNVKRARLIGSLLLIAVTSLVVPTVTAILVEMTQANVVKLSRAAAVILLVIYILYLLFQLKTHAQYFNEPSKKGIAMKKRKRFEPSRALASVGGASAATAGFRDRDLKPYDGTHDRPSYNDKELDPDEDDEPEEPQLSTLVAMASLIINTTLLAFNTRFTTDSIQELTETTALSQTYVSMSS